MVLPGDMARWRCVDGERRSGRRGYIKREAEGGVTRKACGALGGGGIDRSRVVLSGAGAGAGGGLLWFCSHRARAARARVASGDRPTPRIRSLSTAPLVPPSRDGTGISRWPLGSARLGSARRVARRVVRSLPPYPAAAAGSVQCTTVRYKQRKHLRISPPPPTDHGPRFHSPHTYLRLYMIT